MTTPYWEQPRDIPLTDPYVKEWWQPPGEDEKDDPECEKQRANSLIQQVKGLEDSQRSVHEQNLWNARLYSNRELANFDWGHGLYTNHNLAPVSLLGENLVSQVVDTMVSIVGKNRTKITPVPRGAGWKTKLAVRRLDKWLYGEFIRNQVFTKARKTFRDACIFGFGVVKVTFENNKLCVSKRFPDDIIVDQNEAVNSNDGSFYHMFERRARLVEDVEAEFDLAAGTIKGTLTEDQAGYLQYRTPGKGWCVVCEGYRIGREGEPGRHVVAVAGKILVDEVWAHEWLPYVFYQFNEPVSGFYWPSVTEQVLPYQVRLNEINEVIRDAQDLVARPRLLVASGSQVNPADLDNLIARIIKYTGIKPEPLTWEAVSPELYAERDREVRSCFEQFGMGQLVAQSKLPGQARLDSSAALREATSITDDRLGVPTQLFEEFYLALGTTMVRVMGASGKDAETTWYSGGAMTRAETIKWSEVDLDENQYVYNLEAASVFSMTPAARRDTLEQRLAQGIITPERYAQQSANPDLESEMSLQAAAAEDIDRVIELLEEGKYESPIPVQDLVRGIQRVTLAYLNLGKYEGVPIRVRTNILKWIAMARAVMTQGTQTPTEGVGGMPATQPAPMMGQGGLPQMGLPQMGMPGGMMGGMPPGQPLY